MAARRIVGLVQARMGSQRLPEKVMRPICGMPLIGHIFDRLQAVSRLDGIVLATTADPRNDLLVDYARRRGISVHREKAEDDIAARLHGAAALVSADAILKVNGDCPMIDPAILRRMLEAWNENPEIDYISNKIIWTWPEGMSAEVIGMPALQWCNDHLETAQDRELVANWIRDHTDRFARISIESGLDGHAGFPTLAVDTPEDLAEAERIFAALYGANPLFGFSEIAHYYITRKTGEKRD